MQRSVGEHTVAERARGALRGQDEVHAERAPAGSDVGEEVVQFGSCGDEGGVLVDDDHEPREIRGRLIDVARSFPGEHTFAMADLCAQALDGPQRPCLVEVGEDARHVRQPGERVERAPAFEVDEKQSELLRSARTAHRDHPRRQQLALARPGHAHDDGVRPVRNEVYDDRLTGTHPDRGGKARASAHARREVVEERRPVDPLPERRRACRE
jgi:hypothetical protein